jgi:urease accessory protein
VNALAEAVVERGGTVRRLSGHPPLVLRQVQSARPHVASLCLVGGAAGPLAGDELHLDIDVRRNAHAQLGATGATHAQGRASTDPGRMHTTVRVAAGGSLRATPPPLVACAGSSTEVVVDIALESDAALDWRELLVLGRTGESAGGIRLDWRVSVDGRPLLRQSIDLRDPAMIAWPGAVRGQRVVATRLLVGDPEGMPGLVASTVVRSPYAVAQQLDDRAVLLTVLAADAVTAARELDELDRALRPNRRI